MYRSKLNYSHVINNCLPIFSVYELLNLICHQFLFDVFFSGDFF